MLRAYQQATVDAIRDAVMRRQRRVMVCVATGGGKTHIAAHIIARAVERGKRVLFLAHRRELIEQTAEHLAGAGVAGYGIIMAGDKRLAVDAPVQVASIQTLIRRELPPADLIFIDEAHRAAANSYRTILENYNDPIVIGLSATPERMDGKGLDDIFHALVDVVSVQTLITDGYLVKPDVYVGREKPNLGHVHTRAGDYQAKELQTAVNRVTLVGQIVTEWKKRAAGMKTVVFATGIEHAAHIAAQFSEAGIKAGMVSGKTPLKERVALIDEWRTGDLDVIANCAVFTEGFDFPALQCCVLARPTKSVALYLQMVGRIMRPPGPALILDHAGAAAMHGGPHLERAWNLAGESEARKKPQAMTECLVCALAFEADPTLFLTARQPARLARDASRILRGSKAESGLATCPGCSASRCCVCAHPVQFEIVQEELVEGYTLARTTCPDCGARYESESPEQEAQRKKNEFDESEARLALMSDEAPVGVIILNEYKRLLREARAKGWKRGAVFHKLAAKYEAKAINAAIPRHTGNWWRKMA